MKLKGVGEMRTEIEIWSQITVHEVSMFVIRVLHHVALHSVYAYSCTESIAPMAIAQRQPGRVNTQEEKMVCTWLREISA